MRVAVVGLGRMGGPMADHLIAAGHEVRVHDLDPQAVASRAERGATPAPTPAAAAAGAEVVSVVVFDGDQARSVLDGPDGAFSTLAGLAVVAVHTTVSIDTMRELAALGADRGLTVVDAGISGGEAGAAAGRLVTMVGGSEAAFGVARPAFEAFSKEVVHAGPLGAGMALKLARNAAGYVMMAAVHEAIDLAVHAGVDPQLLQHVITETGVLDQALAPFALGGPGPLGPDGSEDLRRVLEHLDSLGRKDLAETLALAGRLDVDLPVTEATATAFSRVTRLASPPA